MGELKKQLTIEDIYEIRQKALNQFYDIERKCDEIKENLAEINNHSPFRLDIQKDGAHGDDYRQKIIDKKCWFYLVAVYGLDKYMLCSDYKKMKDQLYNYNFPEFTKDNAEAWLFGLKGMIYESVQKMIEKVFEGITNETYWTGGSSYSTKVKKKRNNDGIDKFFILSTSDYTGYGWRWDHVSLTDDLEKACYLLDGKLLPKETLKIKAQSQKVLDVSNDYLKVKFCKNGNTHYAINEDIRSKLNYYGAKKGVFGEKIKIKIFEK